MVPSNLNPDRRSNAMRMNRWISAMVVVSALVAAAPTWSAERAIITKRAKDVVVTLKSESAKWGKGKNAFAIEFTSAKDKQPLDVGKVTVTTSMAMPGMAPMIAGATVSPDKTPGRYLGTIEFPDLGTREVTLSWDGPAGRGSTKFSVPVR
ncbi:MAG: hypothetical protein C5B48_13440 [Candidatus Rokuibacteriota bacterium]|nr:MAG: hypothetical protein C5B48_13440 [Candidatus Rokubacteria bacterium]